MVLEKGQFAAVEVSQKSTNVEWYAVQTGGQVIVEVSQKSSAVKIRIVDPAGALRGTFNKPKDNGETQKAAWISDTAGIWMVKIGAPAATSPTGDYEIKWTVQREATAIDGAIIEADSLDSIAHTYLAQGKQAEAKSLYEQALKIRLNVLGPEHLQVAASLAFLSDLCNKQRRFAAADSFLEKALSIREKVLGPDHPALNRTLIPLALFRNTLRRFPESESLLQRALTIQEKSATPNYNQMADILLHLGAIVRGQNKYAEAEPFYMRAVAILEKMFGPEDSKVAEGCNNLARLYRDQGKYVEAEPLNRRALTIAEKNFGASHRNVAICQTNLAVVLSRLGKYAEAESLHTRAVATMEKILGSNHYQVAMLLNNLAQLFQAQSKYALARKFFEKALAIHEKAGSTRSLEMIACLINLADTILKQDRSKGDTCSLLIDRAFDFLKAKPEQFYFYARAYRLRAQLRRQQGEEKGALDDFIEALRYAERLRSQSGTSETTRADYFEEFTQVFDQIVSLELQTGQMQEAFTYSERARAGVLSQALQEAAAKTFAGIPASLLQKDKIMREQMAAIEPEIKKGAATKSPLDSLKSKNLEEQYLVLAAAHNDLLKHLEHDYPRYYDLKYQTRTVSVPELQKSLADHVAVLEYFIGDSALHIFAVTKDRFGVITVPKDSGFAKLVEAFYFAVRKADTPKYLATANALYEFLIEPIDEHLAGKDKLVIIPHNLLYKVPFEALIKTPFKSAERKTVDYRQLDYLVKHFDISYHYSATLYAKSLQERATRLADEATASNSFMGFAPVFRDNDQTGYTLASKDLPWLREENDESVRGIVVEGRKFVELKYSEGEIKSIVTLFTKKAKAQES
ncbi:MAG: tetratricopeptide repeat protein, partial [bacterium]